MVLHSLLSNGYRPLGKITGGKITGGKITGGNLTCWLLWQNRGSPAKKIMAGKLPAEMLVAAQNRSGACFIRGLGKIMQKGGAPGPWDNPGTQGNE